MTSRPILFSAPMVRAILAGTKTQTRRVINPQPQPNGGEGLHPVAPYACPDGRWIWVLAATGIGGDPFHCPYGVAGDTSWVRETWREDSPDDPEGAIYRADEEHRMPAGGKWKPSIFMPRWASRITLRVTAVRVERLQNISEADATAEGITDSWPEIECNSDRPYRDGYQWLWDSINAERAPWASNPWVWVIAFERIP